MTAIFNPFSSTLTDALSWYGTEMYNIDGYDAEYSLLPMWRQVNEIKGRMLPIMQNAKYGVNLSCFSQGELEPSL